MISIKYKLRSIVRMPSLETGRRHDKYKAHVDVAPPRSITHAVPAKLDHTHTMLQYDSRTPCFPCHCTTVILLFSPLLCHPYAVPLMPYAHGVAAAGQWALALAFVVSVCGYQHYWASVRLQPLRSHSVNGQHSRHERAAYPLHAGT